jgi:hypothetical protein
MSLGFLKELKLEVLQSPTTPMSSGAPPTTPSGGPPKAPTKPAEDVATNNPHFLEAVFGEYKKLNKVRARQIRRRIAEKELPPLPISKVDKEPMCLAWHTKGQCNGRCPRAADHVAYTAEEAKALATWCAAHYPKE